MISNILITCFFLKNPCKFANCILPFQAGIIVSISTFHTAESLFNFYEAKPAQLETCNLFYCILLSFCGTLHDIFLQLLPFFFPQKNNVKPENSQHSTNFKHFENVFLVQMKMRPGF